MARGLGGRRQPLQRVAFTWLQMSPAPKRQLNGETSDQKPLGDITCMFSLVGRYTHGRMSTNQSYIILLPWLRPNQ